MDVSSLLKKNCNNNNNNKFKLVIRFEKLQKNLDMSRCTNVKLSQQNNTIFLPPSHYVIFFFTFNIQCVNTNTLVIKWTSTQLRVVMKLYQIWVTASHPPSTQILNFKTSLYTLVSKYAKILRINLNN